MCSISFPKSCCCSLLVIRSVSSFLSNLKVCQRLPEYGVHFHRVLPEKRSQTGIMLGIYSKGVLIFEVLNGNRTPVLRFPWRDTKKISFTVRCLNVHVYIWWKSHGREFPEKKLKKFSFRLFDMESFIWCVYVFLYGRKRRFACRTLRTGSNICFRQTVRRPASICCNSARPSTNSTCTWKPDRTTKNCRTWVRKKEKKSKQKWKEKANIYLIFNTLYV